MITKRTCGLPLICLVCGDTARGINFNVMSCMSCKTFFRRHGTKSKMRGIQCLREKTCEINVRTRGDCTACRLQKCFSLGMDSTLIGNRCFKTDNSKLVRRQTLMKKKTKSELPQPCTLSLLENDSSTLSKDDWNLLSNIVHAYDATNIIPHTKYRLHQHALLPPKIRLKPSTALAIIEQVYSTFQLLIKFTPYYHMLSMDAGQKLAHHNCEIFIFLNALLVVRETNAYDYPAYRIASDMIYPPETARNFESFFSRLEPNGLFVRIILFLCIFSSNCGVVRPDSSAIFNSEFDSISIFNLQNMFVTMFWKYLLYQFGFTDAVRLFSSYVKYIINIIQNLSKKQGNQHDTMVNAVIEDVKRSLTFDNELCYE